MDFIERLLAAGQLEDAKHVYELGCYSRSYAELTLGFEGLPGDIEGHSMILGKSVNGDDIKGISLNDAKLGDKKLRVEYYNLDNPEGCFVGGHPDPETGGCMLFSRCFHASSLHFRFRSCGPTSVRGFRQCCAVHLQCTTSEPQ